MSGSTLNELKSNPFFGVTGEAVLEKLLPFCKPAYLRAGEELNPAAARRSVFIIQSGFVVVYGRSTINVLPYFINWLGRGNLIGEFEALSRRGSEPASIIATDDCTLTAISARAFRAQANSNLCLRQDVDDELFRKIDADNKRGEVTQMPGKTRYNRVAKMLSNLLDARHPEREINEKNLLIDGTLLNDHIAGYVAASEDAVGRALRRLEHKNGIIKRIWKGRRSERIIVVNQELLEEAWLDTRYYKE